MTAPESTPTVAATPTTPVATPVAAPTSENSATATADPQDQALALRRLQAAATIQARREQRQSLMQRLFNRS